VPKIIRLNLLHLKLTVFSVTRKMQMTYSVTEYKDFTNAFFTFKITFSFTAHTQMKCNLCPYEEYGLPCAIFMKLKHTQQYYIHSFCSEIYPNLTINVDSMDKYLFTSPRKVKLSLS
jgi:hypothetical protein